MKWKPSPFPTLDRARALIAPRARVYHRWIGDGEWLDFIVLPDEDDDSVQYVVAQKATQAGRQGPVKERKLVREALEPEGRVMQTGNRYAGPWSHNPDWHGGPDPRKFQVVASGRYVAYKSPDNFIHEVLYDEDGQLFRRVLCPPVR